MSFIATWPLARRQAFLAGLLPKPVLCFDVGSNHGECTAALLSLGHRVVAIEPQPDVAMFVADAFPQAVKQRRLSVVCAAAAAAPGTVCLHEAQDAARSMSTVSTIFMEVANANGNGWTGKTLDVHAVTLDDLIAEYGSPYYVKIDVEGYELEVLHGLRQALPLISIEFNTQRRLLQMAVDCIRELAKLDRYEFNYHAEGFGLEALQFGRWVSAEVMEYTLVHDIARAPLFGDIFARRLYACSPVD